MDNILEKIELNKEILSTLPTNNKKNLGKYIDKVKELKEEYKEYEEEILEELQKRYDKIILIENSSELNDMKKEIENIEMILYLFNDVKTSYEKMEIDKKIYKLNKFYKENLGNINEEILICINKFNNVGIKLTPLDFDYSKYVNEYMTTFFEEKKEDIANSRKLKDKFENMYWKCPDIIIHIELNFRYLYLKNQNLIDKFFEKQKTYIIQKLGFTADEIIDKYFILKINLIEKMNIDKDELVQQFLTNKLNVKNFSDDKLQSNYDKIVQADTLLDADENQIKEINERISKFLHNLYEFKNYYKFQFIFDDIKKKYMEKNQYKNIYNDTKKQINAKEKMLRKLNKKLSGKGLLVKRKEEKRTLEYNSLVKEIEKLYKELDENEVKNKILTKLDDNSTIYDFLYFANSFYNYMVKCILENNKGILQSEVENLINEFNEFLNDPYITIIKNITILEDKNISMMISDRYKLFNFNVNKDDINIDNIDSLIDVLENIETSCNIRKSEINLKDMEFICDFKKIKKSNK